MVTEVKPAVLTELSLACPRCLDSTIFEVEFEGLTSSGEDQEIYPILKCSRGCRSAVILVNLELIQK